MSYWEMSAVRDARLVSTSSRDSRYVIELAEAVQHTFTVDLVAGKVMYASGDIRGEGSCDSETVVSTIRDSLPAASPSEAPPCNVQWIDSPHGTLPVLGGAAFVVIDDDPMLGAEPGEATAITPGKWLPRHLLVKPATVEQAKRRAVTLGYCDAL